MFWEYWPWVSSIARRPCPSRGCLRFVCGFALHAPSEYFPVPLRPSGWVGSFFGFFEDLTLTICIYLSQMEISYIWLFFSGVYHTTPRPSVRQGTEIINAHVFGVISEGKAFSVSRDMVGFMNEGSLVLWSGTSTCAIISQTCPSVIKMRKFKMTPSRRALLYPEWSLVIGYDKRYRRSTRQDYSAQMKIAKEQYTMNKRNFSWL